MPMQQNRIQFIHALRGVACLLVVFDHLFYSPKYFNIGQFGVGIFFLISGFVIPISAAATSPGEFFIRRLFRIYPISIVTTLLIVLISACGINAWHKATIARGLEINAYTISAAMFQVWDVLNADPIRPIFWTLVIEEKFYLLFFIIKLVNPAVQIDKIMGVFFMVFFTALAIAVTTNNAYAASVILRNSMFIAFMLMGTLYYFRYQDRIALGQYYQLSGVILASSLLCLLLSPDGKSFDMSSGVSMIERFGIYQKWDILLAYGLALVVFALVFKHRESRQVARLLVNDYVCFFANISYPLYVIHLNVQIKWIPIKTLNALIVFAVAVAISYLLHRWVEVPGIDGGRLLARLIKRRRATVSA